MQCLCTFVFPFVFVFVSLRVHWWEFGKKKVIELSKLSFTRKQNVDSHWFCATPPKSTTYEWKIFFSTRNRFLKSSQSIFGELQIEIQINYKYTNKESYKYKHKVHIVWMENILLSKKQILEEFPVFVYIWTNTNTNEIQIQIHKQRMIQIQSPRCMNGIYSLEQEVWENVLQKKRILYPLIGNFCAKTCFYFSF